MRFKCVTFVTLVVVIALHGNFAEAGRVRPSQGSACLAPGFWDQRKPSIRDPVVGSVVKQFGLRRQPILGDVRFHAGLDYRVPAAKPVPAGGVGHVIELGQTPGGGWFVRIDYGEGLYVLYRPLFATTLVRDACVRDGQVIGWIGGSPKSGFARLHVEFRHNGFLVDPGPWLSPRRPQPLLPMRPRATRRPRKLCGKRRGNAG